ncbi:DNA recombination protein RmuC [Bacillus sp. AFS096315]|nr:DNA recombination protein RmuC [Bacillus sp. AFS096315]
MGELSIQQKNQFDTFSTEMKSSATSFNQTLFSNIGEMANQQKNLFDNFSSETKTTLGNLNHNIVTTIGELGNQHKNHYESFSKETKDTLTSVSRNVINTISEIANQQKNLLDSFSKQLTDLTKINERKLDGVRTTVEQKLTDLQLDNNKKLEQMRHTVDEKLHGTLEKRLGESFKQVSDRLEQVHKGLGDMQNLATGVGDLRRVLSNVKARGILGEIQLGNLLEQILSPDQYDSNVITKKGSSERVEYAVKLPSKDENGGNVYLPIDSKFPLEAYQRLLDAEESGDVIVAGEAAKQLESGIKLEAKRIREKYLNPPQTTDFAVMFLPFEGLYAEVLRRSGLWDILQREYKVIITGPTTLAALLNSLQMGFRTLAIQKRSSEVWDLLGAVKTEFGRFGNILDKTKKKLQEASNTIDDATKRGRAIERKLKNVQELPVIETNQVLSGLELIGTE